MASLVQDPTDPTGVKDLTPRGNSEVKKARERKAKAALALSMRTKLKDWDEIAEALGYPTGQDAQRATELALGSGLYTPESQEMMRHIAGARLEQMLASIYGKATDEDSPDQLAAYDRALRTIREWADIFGFRAPQQFVINNPSMSQIQELVDVALAGQTVEIEEADIFEGEVVEDEEQA